MIWKPSKILNFKYVEWNFGKCLCIGTKEFRGARSLYGKIYTFGFIEQQSLCHGETILNQFAGRPDFCELCSVS